MTYPTISEYVEAIKLAEENLDQLNYLRPVLDKDGNPVMSSGNFAVVFKMQDDSGNFYALKCFTRDQEGRAEAYKIICAELAKIASPYFVNTEYYDNELFVDTNQSTASEFPVLLMDWVDGRNLTQYIEGCDYAEPICKDGCGVFTVYYDNQSIYRLSFNFNQFAQWMVEQPFAHGDIKPDNIMVRDDGSIFLVDYDGMFFPQMRGQKAREIGSPDYQRPDRNRDNFNQHIDDFALATIALSITALAIEPEDFAYKTNSDGMLLSAADYKDIAYSEIFQSLLQLSQHEIEIGKFVSTFIAALSGIRLNRHHFDLSGLVTSYADSNGVMTYRHVFLLGLNQQERVVIPNYVKKIGDFAFKNVSTLKSIIIPNSVTSIGKYAFSDCSSLSNVTIPNSVTLIGDFAFGSCSSLKSVTIPNSVIAIGYAAFGSCSSLTSIVVEESNTVYDSRNNCNAIIETATNTLIAACQNTTIPTSVSSIGDFAFAVCTPLKSVTIPNSVTSIGFEAFIRCSSLTSVTIPNSVTEIGEYTFYCCSSLTSVTIPNSVTSIGFAAFHGCSSLTSVTIPNSVTSIGNLVFDDCCNLSEIIIPAGTRNKFAQLLPDYAHLLKEDGISSNGDDDMGDDLPF